MRERLGYRAIWGVVDLVYAYMCISIYFVQSGFLTKVEICEGNYLRGSLYKKSLAQNGVENGRKAGIPGYMGSVRFGICIYVYINIFCAIGVSHKGGTCKGRNLWGSLHRKVLKRIKNFSVITSYICISTYLHMYIYIYFQSILILVQNIK